ncbi:MAG: polysaccharide deacetylase family protein [Nitriliruptoraceae bacterium]
MLLAVLVLLMLLVVSCAGAGDGSEDGDSAEVTGDAGASGDGADEGGGADDEAGEADGASEPEEVRAAEPGDAEAADEEGDEEAAAEPLPDPAEVGANELGVVPVLMYHQLREEGGSVYDMTEAQYRQELEWLFDNGYRPITTSQLARGEIDTPPGTKPVVLTYDDSTSSQATLTDDGELDPATSLGILVEIAARYDDVEPRASVYVITSSLFGGTAAGERVLEVLHGHGMELGNHTHTHPNLRGLSSAEVQEELATNVAVVTELVPDAEVATFSLPLGVWPDDRAAAVSGSSGSGSYRHEGVLLVGANPAPSPFDAAFDPLAIPRIRSNVDPEAEFESTWWFGLIGDGGKNAPFVSDGDPDTISFPTELADRLAPSLSDRANPY